MRSSVDKYQARVDRAYAARDAAVKAAESELIGYIKKGVERLKAQKYGGNFELLHRTADMNTYPLADKYYYTRGKIRGTFRENISRLPRPRDVGVNEVPFDNEYYGDILTTARLIEKLLKKA